MKIALVAENASPRALTSAAPANAARANADPSDHTQRVSALARTLAGQGHRVTVYARKDSPTLPRRTKAAPGLTIEYLPAGPAAKLPAEKLLGHMAAFSEHLARHWHRSTPDVVHAHYWTGGLAALAAARGLPVPVVQTFHSLGADERRHNGPRAGGPSARIRLESVIGRSVSAVLASSTGELPELARLGVPRASIAVVPCGVDTNEFLPDGPVARRSARPRLLAVDSLSGQHALDTVVRALAGVPGAELVIAGGPPRAQLSENAIYCELLRLAKQVRVDDRLIFTGLVSRSRMPALLRSADLLVHPATYEPFGMVPLEAMACGTPVVAATGSSHEDAVIDGTTGALIRPGRPALLAQRIRQLLASPMLLEGFGIAAADRARARYSWDRIGRETTAVYQRHLRAA